MLANMPFDRLAEFGIEVAEHDARAVSNEHLHNRLADAACTAGDDRDLTVE